MKTRLNPSLPASPALRPVAAALLLAALLSGCGGSSTSSNDTPTAQPADAKTPQMRCAPAPASGQRCAS